MQIGDRRAPRVILVARCGQRQAGVDHDREGRICAGTVGIADPVGQGGGTSRARRAGQRACAGGKGQTRHTGQSVGQRPRAAGRCRQLQIADRRALCVILVARCSQRQAGVDHDRKGRSRAGTVGIADHVGQGGGTSRARRAGQRACAGGKGQTRHTGQSVGQRPRAAGRCWQNQIADRRAPRVILVARCGQRQAGVDHDREGRTRAGTVGIGDHVGQGGGTSRARRAGQRACAGGKGQTRHTGQSVGQRPRAAGRFRQLQSGDRRVLCVILVARCSQRQAGVDRDGEGRIRAGIVGIGDRVGQGGGTSGGARRAGQRACAGGKAQTRRQGAGQSVHQRRRAAGRCWQNQIADRRAPRVILVARCSQRQAGVDHDREGRICAGTVGIGDRVGQGGGTSRARRAGQRACAGGKGQTRHTGQSVGQRPRAAGRCWQNQIADRRALRVILVARCGQRQAVADTNREGRICAGTVGIADPVGQGGGTSRVRRAGQRACAGVKGQTRHTGQSVRQRRRAAGRFRQLQSGDRRVLCVILVGRGGQRQAGVDRDGEGRIRAVTVGIGDRVGQGGGTSGGARRAGQRACAGGKAQTRRQGAGQSVGQRHRAAGRCGQLQSGDRRVLCVILVGRRGQRQVGVDRDGEGRIRAVTVGIADRVGQGGGTSGGARRAGQRACAGGKAQTRRQGAGQSVHQRRRAAGRCWQNQIADRRAPRVILVARCGQRQAVADTNREGRICASTVGIADPVGQGGGTSRVRRAGQRACAGGKGQTRHTGQSVGQRPRAAGRCWQNQIADRRVLCVILVGRGGQRQVGVDRDGEGRSRAVTVGIGDRVGQGGGTSGGARRAGQRACAGGKAQTRRQGAGQSVGQRHRAAGRCGQNQIADRRAPRVILVARCGQRQAGADTNREGRICAGTVGIGDRVGQGGGTSGGARRAGQRACAGGKGQTRHTGQSVGQRPRAAGRCRQNQIADRCAPRVILVGRGGQRQVGVDRDGEGRIRAVTVGIGDRVGQGGGISRARRAGQRACVGVKVQTRHTGQSVGQRPRAAGRCRQNQIADRCAPRVILVGRGGQRQVGVDRDGEGRIRAVTVGIGDRVGQGGGISRARRAGQRACVGVKVQTRHTGQSVGQRPRAAGRYWQLQSGDRRVLCVILVGRGGQRQAGVDRDGEGRICAGTVGIGDRVGQGGGISRARRAGQRACVGVKVQTRHTGQSVGQRPRAAGRYWQLQSGDRRVLCVILVGRGGQRQAGVDRDGEGRIRAVTVGIGDRVGQGGGTSGGARRAGQRACAGGKGQTRHTGQSVGQRPRAAGRYWQLQSGDRRVLCVILVGRGGQRQAGVDRDGEGRICAGTVGIGDRVGQGGGTSGGARRAGQRACAGGKGQTRHTGQSVGQRPRAAGRCRQNQIADRCAPRVILVGRGGQRQAGVDRDGEGRICAGTVGIGDRVGQGGGTSGGARRAGQRACAGGKGQTRHTGQSVGQRPRAAGRCRQNQIADRCAPRVILVGRGGQRQAGVDRDGEGRICAVTVGIGDRVGQGGGISRARRAGQRACVGVKVQTRHTGQSVGQRPRAAGRCWQNQIADRRVLCVILVGRGGQRQAGVDRDGEGRICAGTVGIGDRVGQGGGTSRVRRAGQRACAGGKVQTRRQAAWPGQSVHQRPRASDRFRQLRVDRYALRVNPVAQCIERQFGADYDHEGRSRAVTVGIGDLVGQGGGTRRVRRAGQRACVGVKVQTRHTGQSVGQRPRAAGRYRQLQSGDRRIKRVILVARCGQRQAGVDRDGEGRRAVTVVIGDLVGQGGGTSRVRRAGQYACAGVKVQTRHIGQSVGQRPGAAGRFRQLQIGDHRIKRVILVGRRGQRQVGVDRDGEGRRAVTVVIGDLVGQGGGTSRVRRAGQYACAGVKVQTRHIGQSVGQRPGAAGRFRQLQIGDHRIKRVILVGRRGQRQAVADTNREGRIRAGIVGIGDHVGQGGGTSGGARRAGQRACAGGKGQTRRQGAGQRVGQRPGAAGRFRQLQIADRRAPRVILVARCGQRQAGVDYDPEVLT